MLRGRAWGEVGSIVTRWLFFITDVDNIIFFVSSRIRLGKDEVDDKEDDHDRADHEAHASA